MTENVPGERLQSERSSAAFGSPLCPVDSVDSVDQARQVCGTMWHQAFAELLTEFIGLPSIHDNS